MEAVPLAGAGIDRTEIRVLLALTPSQRLASLVDEAPTPEILKAVRDEQRRSRAD